MGKRYAQLTNGDCPKHAQELNGKELNITWAGTPPFISWHRPGYGSDFLVVKLLAEKFGFTTNFLREHIVDIEISNGTYAGMLYRVSDIYFY